MNDLAVLLDDGQPEDGIEIDPLRAVELYKSAIRGKTLLPFVILFRCIMMLLRMFRKTSSR